MDMLRSVFPRHRAADNGDTEKGRSRPPSTVLGGSIQQGPENHDEPVTQSYIETPDEKLVLFRLLTGIISSPSMVNHRTSPFHSRAARIAPNVGIYERVVHREQVAKSGYKYFSWLINGCLGLQIIVASALTALGAAGASHQAVTAFGAINTVIAGLLTFLKGSGLPNRMKYYQKEWGKLREFIEQRERDLSRPGCDVDVYALVRTIEEMYEETDADTEANTPDRYASLHNSSPRGNRSSQMDAAVSTPRAMQLEVPSAAVINDRSRGVQSQAMDKLAGYQSQVRDRAEGELGGIKGLQTRFSGTVKELGLMAEEIEGKAKGAMQGLKDHEERVIDNTHKGIDARAERGAGGLRDIEEGVSDRVSQAVHIAKEMEAKAAEALRGLKKHEEDVIDNTNRDIEHAKESARPRNIAGDFLGRFSEAVDDKPSGDRKLG